MADNVEVNRAVGANTAALNDALQRDDDVIKPDDVKPLPTKLYESEKVDSSLFQEKKTRDSDPEYKKEQDAKIDAISKGIQDIQHNEYLYQESVESAERTYTPYLHFDNIVTPEKIEQDKESESIFGVFGNAFIKDTLGGTLLDYGEKENAYRTAEILDFNVGSEKLPFDIQSDAAKKYFQQEGYTENQIKELTKATTKREFDVALDIVNRDRKRVEIQQEAGVSGIVSSLIASTLDPVELSLDAITFGSNWIRRGGKLARMVKHAGVAGGIGVGSLYATRRPTDEDVTNQELLFTLGLSSALGSAAGYFSRRVVNGMIDDVNSIERNVGKSEFERMADNLDDLRRRNADNIDDINGRRVDDNIETPNVTNRIDDSTTTDVIPERNNIADDVTLTGRVDSGDTPNIGGVVDNIDNNRLNILPENENVDIDILQQLSDLSINKVDNLNTLQAHFGGSNNSLNDFDKIIDIDTGRIRQSDRVNIESVHNRYISENRNTIGEKIDDLIQYRDKAIKLTDDEIDALDQIYETARYINSELDDVPATIYQKIDYISRNRNNKEVSALLNKSEFKKSFDNVVKKYKKFKFNNDQLEKFINNIETSRINVSKLDTIPDNYKLGVFDKYTKLNHAKFIGDVINGLSSITNTKDFKISNIEKLIDNALAGLDNTDTFKNEIRNLNRKLSDKLHEIAENNQCIWEAD